MPFTFTDEQLDAVEKEKGGKGLRAILEEVLAENRTLNADALTGKAQNVIAEHGYALVKAEDLEGVAEGELETKAQAIQEQREAERSAMREEVYRAKGLEGSDLESAVKADMDALLGNDTQERIAYRNVNEAATVAGRPVVQDDPNAEAIDDLSAGLVQAEKSRKARRF